MPSIKLHAEYVLALRNAQRSGGKYLACDTTMRTWVFREKPTKGPTVWHGPIVSEIATMPLCRWEDATPTSIEELLRQAEDQTPLFINGYPVADLEFAAKLMNSAGLTPADLRKCIDNIEYVTTLVYNDVRRAMDNVGAEYAARMLNGYYLKEKE